MRTTYHEALDAVINDLHHMCTDIEIAVDKATKALLNADLSLAEEVISNDVKLDNQYDILEHNCFSLLARQAPVAGELRQIVAALKVSSNLARMGDLSAHVAKVARLRYPARAVPEPLLDNFSEMATIAKTMVHKAGDALQLRDTQMAEKMAADDEEMDRLRSEQFGVMLSDDWASGVECAVDCALLGRYYERISDHAVIVASRVIYIVTGEVPTGDYWTIA